MSTSVWPKKNKHPLKAAKEPHGRQTHTLLHLHQNITPVEWEQRGKEQFEWVSSGGHCLLPVSVSTVLSRRKDCKLVNKSCHYRKWRSSSFAWHIIRPVLSHPLCVAPILFSAWWPCAAVGHCCPTDDEFTTVHSPHSPQNRGHTATRNAAQLQIGRRRHCVSSDAGKVEIPAPRTKHMRSALLVLTTDSSSQITPSVIYG